MSLSHRLLQLEQQRQLSGEAGWMPPLNLLVEAFEAGQRGEAFTFPEPDPEAGWRLVSSGYTTQRNLMEAAARAVALEREPLPPSRRPWRTTVAAEPEPAQPSPPSPASLSPAAALAEPVPPPPRPHHPMPAYLRAILPDATDFTPPGW